LCFFKHVFGDFKLDTATISEQEFAEWRAFFKDLLENCLTINSTCADLLSNNRLTDQGEEMVEVDCRGHPIEGGNPNNEGDDYANLILVGIWLAVKENG